MSGTAAPAVGLGAPAFQPAVDFFRAKLNVPTPSFDTLQRGQHAVAFTVAGAMQAALLGDLRSAVDKAISEGWSLGRFRQEFDQIVRTHGWAHKGEPGWRARVIYETNMRTAYMAGRWRQIEETREAFPWLRYSAVMDQRTRLLHRAWHGTILPVGDAWWRTHYPPNGWGCRCTVMQVSRRLLEREGWKVSDPAPSGAAMPRSVRTPEGNRIELLPPGIDPGWNYNVGLADAAWQAVRRANDQLDRLPPDIAAAVYQAMLRPAAGIAAQREAAAAEFRAWAEALHESKRPDGTRRVVGAISPEVLAGLREAGREPANAAVSISASEILHLVRDAKARDGAVIPLEMALTIPAWIGRPEQVLLETAPGGALLLVYSLGAASSDVAKVVVQLGLTVTERLEAGGPKRRVVLNSIRTITRINPQALLDRTKYRSLDGSGT